MSFVEQTKAFEGEELLRIKEENQSLHKLIAEAESASSSKATSSLFASNVNKQADAQHAHNVSQLHG